MEQRIHPRVQCVALACLPFIIDGVCRCFMSGISTEPDWLMLMSKSVRGYPLRCPLRSLSLSSSPVHWSCQFHRGTHHPEQVCGQSYCSSIYVGVLLSHILQGKVSCLEENPLWCRGRWWLRVGGRIGAHVRAGSWRGVLGWAPCGPSWDLVGDSLCPALHPATNAYRQTTLVQGVSQRLAVSRLEVSRSFKIESSC